MQELEKILEEIEKQKSCCLMIGYAKEYNQGALKMAEVIEDIIRKHMNDGWIPVEERMPTKEECEKNQTGCIKFWITYGYRGNYSTLLANCKWVEADNEDGTTGDFAEFWVDQYPQIFYPSLNLIRGWKIIEAPDPYRPERGVSIQQE